ncbi:hypothetical protein BGZ63DRAFT_78718 [Mariannaea sp. PMI_226]|nr:hypothetical protein BGZ63DRAFT_78718 [Mariannaea sp. PMI_226]
MIPTALTTLLLAFGAAGNGLSEPIRPNHECSRENANRIFNAIHSAGRQWGSSYYHNGFSFFPSTIPRGTLLYHGDSKNKIPEGPEWLAFEIEHAEGFARSRKGRKNDGPPGVRPPGDHKEPGPGKGDPRKPPPANQDEAQKPLEDQDRQELRRRQISPGSENDDGNDDNDELNFRGYLHTYQATRDLNLLYIDGMSAGKTSMGTLDTQDLLLRENSTDQSGPALGEWARALDLCKIAASWGVDGVVRTEAGFEAIFCDFGDGLNLVRMTRTMMPDDKLGDEAMAGFMWARAIGERYNGLDADRLRIDFSSMVSALFFPVNISSSDADRPDLVRLESVSKGELKDIKTYLEGVVRQPRRFTVNWQGVVDLIVGRFAKRMASMSLGSLKADFFIDEIETITATWYDAPPLPNDAPNPWARGDDEVNRTADAIDRCRNHFLLPATIDREKWSAEDELIFTSIDTVMEDICESFFYVRELLYAAAAKKPRDDDEDDKKGRDAMELQVQGAVEAGRATVNRLMNDLGWTIWKQQQPCPADEVLFIAMWPFGFVEDHWNPGCRSVGGLWPPDGEPYWDTNKHFRRGT